MKKLHRGLFLAALSIAVLVFAGGLWLEDVVSGQLEEGLEEDLTTLRDTNLEALQEWMQAQEKASSLAAAEDGVRETALEIIHSARSRSGEPGKRTVLAERLANQLASTLSNWEFEGYLLISDQHIVAADSQEFVDQKISETEYLDVLGRLEHGRSLLTRPREVRLEGQHEHVMWVASAIRDEEGVQGALAFRMDPAKAFARILRMGRFGRSGETLAFDAEGLLMSRSRFDEQLRELGLLKGKEASHLELELRDPGGDLSEGAVMPKDLERRPLTEDVRSAVDGRTDANVKGYADYRGVEVAGAWTWLPEYGLGMVTKVDYEEAYASAKVIRRVTRALVIALVVLALVLIAVGQILAQLRDEANRLGQYTLEGKIGEGGMGSVYRARHALLRRPTAVKMIKSKEIDERTRERFEREVQATAQLAHPNTIAIYDYGHTDEGVFYYAMEYLSGGSLFQLVSEFGPLPQARVVHILQQALGSLAEAHEAGLVHRDIKPANIMIALRGGVPDMIKVLDFGLVKDLSNHDTDSALTASNALTGTPHYMAPEAITSPELVDQRSDLYAIGAVAHFLLTGQNLFEGPNIMAVLTKHIADPPPRVGDCGETVDPRLERLILECLAKDPEQRPASAGLLLERLELLSREDSLRWTQAEAGLWWAQHPQFGEHADESLANVTPTVAIDLSRRAQLEPTVTL